MTTRCGVKSNILGHLGDRGHLPQDIIGVSDLLSFFTIPTTVSPGYIHFNDKFPSTDRRIGCCFIPFSPSNLIP